MKKLENILRSKHIQFERLDGDSTSSYQEKWRAVYSRQVFDRTNEWTLDGCDWHAFSKGYTDHVTGNEGFNMYRKAFSGSCVIIPNLDYWHGYRFTCDRYVDLSLKRFDLSICPESMVWTFVHTHEEPTLGPYFSSREMAEI